ncbi:hypothetical protein GCM10027037_35040 [Mucilaginibacter koreensis]
MFAASSCVKKEYYDTNNNKTLQFTTTNSSWVTSDAGKNFATTLKIPEIDNYFNSHGGVLVYISYDNGATFEQLPEVYQGVSYSYEHTVGKLIIGAQSYSGNGTIDNPGNTTIKVVLIDSNE